MLTGLEAGALKPVLGALIEPPASLLLVAVAGAATWATGRGQARRGQWRRKTGAGMLGVSLLLLWLCGCIGTARWLENHVLRPPAALDEQALNRMRGQAGAEAHTAILVLGGGRSLATPEYGHGELTPQGLVRLRYGLWLAQRTAWPLAYTGGVGWGQDGAVTEADIADIIVREARSTPLRWREDRSRDTAENARNSVPMLRAAGVRRIVLVTHASHMPRALRWFNHAAQGTGIEIVPAPTAYTGRTGSWVQAWLPSGRGYQLVQAAVHEVVGLWLAP